MDLTPERLTELKQIELEMLRAFVSACEKLNLQYYLIEGTLLGAVRHQGFIPWDDDIDVGMPRKDYERFLKEGPAYLPEHLFIQSVDSDPEYPVCFAKIRNSNTTFLESATQHLKINHGVYIDVFPLDYYPESAAAQKKLHAKNKRYKRRIATLFNLPKPIPLKTRLKSALYVLLYPSVKKVIAQRDALYRSVTESSLMMNFGSAWGAREIMPADWYGSGVTLTFEGLDVTVPAKYHEWLTQVYGDYMQLPPVEKRVTHHFTDVIDLKTPYTEYLKKTATTDKSTK